MMMMVTMRMVGMVVVVERETARSASVVGRMLVVVVGRGEEREGEGEWVE